MGKYVRPILREILGEEAETNVPRGTSDVERECKHPTCEATCRKKKEPKARKPLPRQQAPIKTKVRPKAVAEKRKGLNQIYAVVSTKYLDGLPKIPASNGVVDMLPACEIKAVGCTGIATGIHHTKGKVGVDTDGTPMLIAVRWFKGSCNSCNLRAETHPEEGNRIPNYGTSRGKNLAE